MSKQRLNDCSKETIDANFLSENPEIPANEKVNVHPAAQPIPQFEEIIFLNNRDPGTTLHFHYASKTHPLRHYDLIHGQRYNLPVEVIRHLEGVNDYDPWSCHERLYGVTKDAYGRTNPGVTGYKPYFQCKPTRNARAA